MGHAHAPSIHLTFLVNPMIVIALMTNPFLPRQSPSPYDIPPGYWIEALVRRSPSQSKPAHVLEMWGASLPTRHIRDVEVGSWAARHW